jgi:hypothetical protein
MRQDRQSAMVWPSVGAFRASPQRAHAGAPAVENSDQQTVQIGTEESRGRGQPQREQEAGRRAQLKLSMGLRSTRTTARHRVVSDGGTSVIRTPESLWKTHLASGRRQMLPVAPSIAHSKYWSPVRDLVRRQVADSGSSVLADDFGVGRNVQHQRVSGWLWQVSPVVLNFARQLRRALGFDHRSSAKQHLAP